MANPVKLIIDGKEYLIEKIPVRWVKKLFALPEQAKDYYDHQLVCLAELLKMKPEKLEEADFREVKSALDKIGEIITPGSRDKKEAGEAPENPTQ